MNDASGGNGVLAIVALVAAAFLYILPALIASSRQHPSHLAIWLVNLVFGWTALGWFLALVWALTGVRDAPSETSPRGRMARCPFCAEEIQLAAIKCKHCGSDLASAMQVLSPADFLELGGTVQKNASRGRAGPSRNAVFATIIACLLVLAAMVALRG